MVVIITNDLITATLFGVISELQQTSIKWDSAVFDTDMFIKAKM